MKKSEDPMAKTEAIIFDVYQTLLDNETNETRQESYEFLSRWLSYHGVAIAARDLRNLYLELCRKEIAKSAEPFPDIEIGVVFSEIIANAAGRFRRQAPWSPNSPCSSA